MEWLLSSYVWSAAKIEVYNHDIESEYQIQIRSKQFPEYPIRSAAEAFTQLRKQWEFGEVLLAVLISIMKSMRNYITSLPLTAKNLQAGYTGLDMKRGQLLAVNVKAQNPTALQATRMPDNISVVFLSDQILDIGFTRTQVQD